MPNAAGEINVRQYWQAGRQAGTIFDQVDGERTDSRSKGETPQMAIESVNIEPPLRSFDHLRRRRRKLIQWRLGFQVRQTFRAENIKKRTKSLFGPPRCQLVDSDVTPEMRRERNVVSMPAHSYLLLLRRADAWALSQMKTFKAKCPFIRSEARLRREPHFCFLIGAFKSHSVK